MTDNDIVKDLEAVIDWFTDHGSNTNTAVIDISRRAIDVIERQKAEIERLTALVEAAEDYLSPLPFRNAFDEEIEKAKSEAIREFAERMKNKSELLAPSVYAEPFRAVSVEEIDNLVAGMTEQ